MHAAMANSTDAYWAVVQIDLSFYDRERQRSRVSNASAPVDCGLISASSSGAQVRGRPRATIRMHPISVPDTRSYAWDPVKDAGMNALDTGQLLYYTSGFLSLQMELQNYFSTTPVGGSDISGNTLAESRSKFQAQLAFIGGLLNASAPPPGAGTAGGNSTSALADAIGAALSSHSRLYNRRAPVIETPLFLRALPQPSYMQSKFWQQFGEIITTCLIIYFCIPAALVGGKLSQELRLGHIEVLSTLPGVRVMHSALAWCVGCWAMVLLWAVAAVVFFNIVLVGCNALIPTLTLLLLGMSLAPIAIMISILLKASDAVTVVVPSVVFVLMLPGLLYCDMAFDAQRTITTEMLLCLSPPSAAALVLRQVCALEALGREVGWGTLSPGAETPMYGYAMMLAFDVVLFALFMVGVSEFAACGPRLGCPPHQDEEDFTDPRQLYVTSVSKGYTVYGGATVSVLSGINSRLAVGTVTSLLGSNGAGKSTLMRIIVGLDSDYDGFIYYPQPDACYAAALAARARAGVGARAGAGDPEDAHSRMIGWCPQHDALFDFLSVHEHLELFADLLGCALGPEYFEVLAGPEGGAYSRFSVSKREKQFNRTLTSLGLVDQRSKPAGDLSGGMKRRLSLALASLGNPVVLVLDEPTSGCDNKTR
jgi:ABC-type multidrug transport system ATPase subunit